MIKVGTFNVENLFDRPKVLNLADAAKTSALLKKIDQLQKELNKAAYNKQKIGELLQDLKGYITIRVDAGRFFKTKTGGPVVAQGPGDWEGAVEFTRMKFQDDQRKNTGALIKKLGADVLCMIEVEGRQAMSDFGRAYLTGANRFPFNMLIDSPNDPRGIDVGLQWKAGAITTLRSNAYDKGKVGTKPSATIFSRDCLEVEIELGGGKRLALLCNHFKSKMGGDTPENLAKREAQSKRVAEIARTRYNLQSDYVVVLGDLNDTPDSAPIGPLMNEAGLHEVFDLTNRPSDDRWTYYYGAAPIAKRKTQIDYVLVSSALKNKVSDVRIWREGMSAVAEGDIPGISPLPGITGWKNAASDHAAITVELAI